MKIAVSQLRRIIREEVEKNLESNSMPLKDGCVVNGDTGESLNVYAVPSKYLRYAELDEMGYTTLPDDQFSELRNELKGSLAGQPKKTHVKLTNER